MKVEFVGTFTEVNLKAVEWLTSNPQVKLIGEVGPIQAGCTASGLSSNDDPGWTITIEYEERAPDVGSRAA
jgi:hypothetical protein